MTQKNMLNTAVNIFDVKRDAKEWIHSVKPFTGPATEGFTVAAWEKLPLAHQEITLRLLEYRLPISDIDRGRFLKIELDDWEQAWRMWGSDYDGCVPDEELGDELLASIQKKFRPLLSTACSMAEVMWAIRFPALKDQFKPVYYVDPSYEDTTACVVVDIHRPVCYLHTWAKAWNFQFKVMAELTTEVVDWITGMLEIAERVIANEETAHKTV